MTDDDREADYAGVGRYDTPDHAADYDPVTRSLVTKLAEVMAAAHRVPKRGHNDFHGYDYATEADIVATVRQELAKRRIMLFPEITGIERASVGEKGQVLTTIKMLFSFHDGDSGEVLSRAWCGAGTDKEDKGIYKAMTGGEKYFLLKTFLIPTGDDPEQAVEAPKVRSTKARAGTETGVVLAERYGPVEPGPDVAGGTLRDEGDGVLRVVRVERRATSNKNVTKYAVIMSDGRELSTIKDTLAALADECEAEKSDVAVEVKATKWGTDLVALRRVHDDDHAGPITLDDVPF